MASLPPAWTGLKKLEDVEKKVEESTVQPEGFSGGANTPTYTVEFDSPRILWDSCGHVRFTVDVAADELFDKILEVRSFWDKLEEYFGDDTGETTEEAETLSDSQLKYLKALYMKSGVDEPEGLDKITKEEAAALIDQLKKATPQATKKAVGRRLTGEGRTDRQAAFIEQLCAQLGYALPEKLDTMSKDEAKELIKKLLAERNK